jgi:hypothetical protein
MTKRSQNGRFEKGQSGNPRGRPPKRAMTTHTTHSGYRATMLEVAAMPVPYVDRETGETGEISLLRANMIALGRKGAAGHAPSAKLFLEKHFEAAGVHGELLQLHRYLLEENARLELQVERLSELVPGRVTGVVTKEEYEQLADAKARAWRERRISVNPPPR